MPLRLLYFVVLYWERQWRAWEQAAAPKPALRLNPVLPLVLYTGSGAWHNHRTLHDLLDEPAEFHGFVPQWGPLFWELGGQDAKALLASGDAWQEMLAVLRVQQEEAAVFEQVYAEAMCQLAPLAAQDHVRWYDLMWIILSWALWRRPGPERQRLLATAQAAQADREQQKEIGRMSQAIAEVIYEEGRLKGQQEGLLKGQQEGKQEGEFKALRWTLRQLLEQRFGGVSEEMVQRIETAAGLERLNAAILQVAQVESPDELTL